MDLFLGYIKHNIKKNATLLISLNLVSLRLS